MPSSLNAVITSTSKVSRSFANRFVADMDWLLFPMLGCRQVYDDDTRHEHHRQAGSAQFTNLLSRPPRESIRALYISTSSIFFICRWQTGVCFVCFQKRPLHGCTCGRPILHSPHLVKEQNNPCPSRVRGRRGCRKKGLPVRQARSSPLSHVVLFLLPVFGHIYHTCRPPSLPLNAVPGINIKLDGAGII